MNRIKKAIIPAAGLGTRFLPVTKSLPKEMLPIIDTPTLQYIVEEALSSGIEEIGVIVSLAKPSIRTHFSLDEELEKKLIESGKVEDAALVRKIANLTKVTFINQPSPRGLGHAVYCAKDFINGEDFAIMLGDDLIINRDGDPVMKQLVEEYNKVHSSVLGVQQVPQEQVSKYGIVVPAEKQEKMMLLKDMVEKPAIEKAPSNCAVLGRYILSSKIFDILENIEPGKGGEIQLTDAIVKLMKVEDVYAYQFDGKRYDIGDKFGFIKATIDFALEREDLKDKVLDYLKEIVK